MDEIGASRRCCPVQWCGTCSHHRTSGGARAHGDVCTCNTARGSEGVTGRSSVHLIVLALVLVGGDRVRTCSRRRRSKGAAGEEGTVGAASRGCEGQRDVINCTITMRRNIVSLEGEDQVVRCTGEAVTNGHIHICEARVWIT